MIILLNLSKLRIRQKHETRIVKLQHVRLTANEKLLIRVIYANKIRDIRLDLHVSIKIKHWMLIRHKKSRNLKLNDMIFIKILNHHFLKTYRLISSNDKILFNDNKLVKANEINDDVKIWFSSAKQAELRNKTKLLNHLHREYKKYSITTNLCCRFTMNWSQWRNQNNSKSSKQKNRKLKVVRKNEKF